MTKLRADEPHGAGFCAGSRVRAGDLQEHVRHLPEAHPRQRAGQDGLLHRVRKRLVVIPNAPGKVAASPFLPQDSANLLVLQRLDVPAVSRALLDVEHLPGVRLLEGVGQPFADQLPFQQAQLPAIRPHDVPQGF